MAVCFSWMLQKQPSAFSLSNKNLHMTQGGPMESESSLNMLPFGLIEIDATGTILYYKPEQIENSYTSPSEIVGRNFFTEITPVAQAREFQDLIKSFGRNHAPATSFNFTFVNAHGTLPVRVLLARIHEQSGLDRTESLFVHIRLGQRQMAA